MTDWPAHQAKFNTAHQQTGISVVRWCGKQGLNYQTARRYIKIKLCHLDSTTDQLNKTAKNTKQTRKRGAPLGNANALKHGGYSKKVTAEICAIAALNQLNEVDTIKPRIMVILEALQPLESLMSSATNTSTYLRLFNQSLGMGLAIDRLIARKTKLLNQASLKRLKIAKQSLREARTKEKQLKGRA